MIAYDPEFGIRPSASVKHGSIRTKALSDGGLIPIALASIYVYLTVSQEGRLPYTTDIPGEETF